MLTLISNDSTLLNTVISNEYGYCTHILNDKMKILWEITQNSMGDNSREIKYKKKWKHHIQIIFN
jgi:hypothetical protein